MSRYAGRGFTLIELLVTIGIVSILSVVVVLTLNPTELLKQSRDSNRFSELALLSTASSHFLQDQLNGFVGTTSVAYISVPDTSTTCANLGLPTLPSGWSYHCAPTSTLRSVNGTGWLPINFTAMTSGAPMANLPVDPINTTSTGLYYAYTASSGGTFHFASGAESSRQRSITGATGKDGGRSWNSFESGNNLALLPLTIVDGAKDATLVLFLPFNENSGSTSADNSGHANNATLVSSPTWTSTDCAENPCLSFSGSNYATVAHNSILQPTDAISVAFWTKTSSLQDYDTPVIKSSGAGWTDGYGFYYQGGNINFWVRQYGTYQAGTSFSNATLTHIVGTFDGSTVKIYKDGVLRTSTNANTTISNNTTALQVGRGDPTGLNYLWKGTLDNVRVYNRTLSAAEVAALYAAGG